MFDKLKYHYICNIIKKQKIMNKGCLIGGVVVAALSGSALSVSGPAAGLTVIVFNAIQQLGSFENFLLAYNI